MVRKLEHTHLGQIIAQNNDLKVLDCWNCGFRHLDPYPDAEMIDRFYTEDWLYAENGAAWFDKEKREHDTASWNPAYRWQTELLGSSGDLIDVGCGVPWFPAYWQFVTNGRAVGVEPSKLAREFWLDVNVEVLPSVDELLASGYQGHLRLSLVLEHVHSPGEFLYDLLPALNGRLMVIVPNDFNPLQRQVLKRDYNVDDSHFSRRGLRDYDSWFIGKTHLNYFTPNTLRLLLQELGLRVVYEGATFPMSLFILDGMDYRGDDALGHRCHEARLEFERVLGPLAFRMYKLMYDALGWGRELVFVAERRE